MSLILIVCQWKFVVNELLDPELAQADQQQLVQKHMKPRRKEGSVRLVGGLVEHEGSLIKFSKISKFLKHFFKEMLKFFTIQNLVLCVMMNGTKVKVSKTHETLKSLFI